MAWRALAIFAPRKELGISDPEIHRVFDIADLNSYLSCLEESLDLSLSKLNIIKTPHLRQNS